MNQKLKSIILKVPFSVFFYRICKRVKNFPSFIKDVFTYKSLDKDGRFALKFGNLYPLLEDKTTTTNFEPHYIYHPAWAARIIAKTNPKKHIDISSTLRFCTMLSAFVPVEFYDYRPVKLNLSNLESLRGDLLALPFEDNSVESISCLHTVEHVGLGRYGDPIDPEGDLKAIAELKRVTKPGGTLLFVSPIGKAKLEFNAHRVYSYDQIISYFEGFELREFALVPDNFKETGLIINAEKSEVDKQNWGCGCFWFVKK